LSTTTVGPAACPIWAYLRTHSFGFSAGFFWFMHLCTASCCYLAWDHSPLPLLRAHLPHTAIRHTASPATAPCTTCLPLPGFPTPAPACYSHAHAGLRRIHLLVLPAAATTHVGSHAPHAATAGYTPPQLPHLPHWSPTPFHHTHLPHGAPALPASHCTDSSHTPHSGLPTPCTHHTPLPPHTCPTHTTHHPTHGGTTTVVHLPPHYLPHTTLHTATLLLCPASPRCSAVHWIPTHYYLPTPPPHLHTHTPHLPHHTHGHPTPPSDLHLFAPHTTSLHHLTHTCPATAHTLPLPTLLPLTSCTTHHCLHSRTHTPFRHHTHTHTLHTRLPHSDLHWWEDLLHTPTTARLGRSLPAPCTCHYLPAAVSFSLCYFYGLSTPTQTWLGPHLPPHSTFTHTALPTTTHHTATTHTILHHYTTHTHPTHHTTPGIRLIPTTRSHCPLPSYLLTHFPRVSTLAWC